MQQLSYDPGDPWFEISGWQIGLQVITFENVYGLDPEAVTVARQGGRTTVTCGQLTWAGGRERCEGSASFEATLTDDGLEVVASARHRKKIRCLKLMVAGLPPGEVAGAYWHKSPLPWDGLILSYPFPFHTPLVFLTPSSGPHLYFESLDDRVRAKRFAMYERDGAVTVELIFEDAADEMTCGLTTPPWRIGRCNDPAAVAARHLEHVERAYGLEPWASRRDVPAWARDIALVASLHGMHWSGYIFNTYDQMVAALRWFADRIEGRRVLAYLPGWEGRYYWQYGDFRPEPRLGGEGGFQRLADGARELGVKLMPMFGANCANRGLENFEQWGESSLLRSVSGHVYQGNKPDWDGSRSHDPGWHAWLNPGAPAWRNRLVDQVSWLVERYNLPAVFFDTNHTWLNDPNYSVYEGIVAVRDSLKARFPDLLITGEGWYDALGAVMPVSHMGAPVQWPGLFSKYCRTFLHVAAGDPSRGSSGVHEFGLVGFRLAPDAEYWWPTVTVVDGTIAKAPDRVEEVIAQARRYAETYLH